FEEGDYKVVFAESVTRRYFENGLWGKQEIKLPKVKQLFYLTISRVFSLYKTQCLREGDKPLPESTVEYYLKNSPAFICETKKESFRKMDPKTGAQEKDDNGLLKRTSTTALVFHVDKIGLMLGTVDKEKDPEGVLNSGAEGVLNFPMDKVVTDLAF
ncbi:MAG TPA: hypothetical protein VFC67_09730, partial [Prolixibacteraceae bacterium]|nr:hypothetical protein [Prolixibacteraceae bacterium]